MKRLVSLAFVLSLFVCSASAQWQSRQLNHPFSQVFFSKSDDAVLLFSSWSSTGPGIFGYTHRNNFNLMARSTNIADVSILSVIGDVNKIFLYKRETNFGSYAFGLTVDSFKISRDITIISGVSRTLFDFSCFCYLSKIVRLSNVVTARLFSNGNFIGSFNNTRNSSPADTMGGVLFSSNNRVFASNAPTYYTVQDFSFPNDSAKGYAVSLNGWVGKTNDSGKNFVTVYRQQLKNFYKVHFVDSSNGWVYGLKADTSIMFRRLENKYPIMMYTPNGGSNWFDLPYDTTKELVKMKFVSPNKGYALFKDRFGTTTTFSTTNNGGQSWSVEWTDSQIELKDFDLIDTSNIALVGYSQTLRTSFYITKGILLGLKPTPSDRLYTATPQPNPTANRFNIPGVGREGALILVNASGQVVKQESFVPGSEVDISYLPKGLYLFRLVSAGSVTQGKVVRE